LLRKLRLGKPRQTIVAKQTKAVAA
jgi:hypothetical protein